MRFYIGHKLPLGFFGGLSFGHYTHVVHRDGTKVPLRDGTVMFWVGFLLFFVLVYWRLR